MKILSKEHQIEFYKEEIRTILEEYRTYLNSRCIDLYNKGELFIGKFEYIDELRNQVIFSFPSEKLPKTKIPLTASRPILAEQLNFYINDLTYNNYRQKCGSDYTDCYGVYYSEQSGKFCIGFNNLEIQFVDSLKKGDSVVFGASDPPLKYYYNLIKITENKVESKLVDDVILGKYHLGDFKPVKIDDSLRLIEKYDSELENQNVFIIQGPPGTGKTFFISRLLDILTRKKKSVMVATLANRSLIELSKKYFELEVDNNSNIYKSNLTLEESREVKKVKPMIKNFLPSSGDILLTTFYKMTGVATEDIVEPIYDYVILEEASQCFLGTIAAAKLLGRKIILVGDPMQLPPIVNQKKPKAISDNIELMTDSFNYFASTIQCPKFIFTTTYRFSENACFQTNSFYENSLVSKSKIQRGNPILLKLSSLYNLNGGSSLYYYDAAKLERLYDFLFERITDLFQINKDFEIAILSSTKAGVKMLRDNLLFKFNLNQDQLKINTVDGVQGLTVDFCYYFAFSDKAPSFSFNIKRFNVATSRARYCTVILMDDRFKITKPFNGFVAEFISKCDNDNNGKIGLTVGKEMSNSENDSGLISSKLPGLKIIDKIDLSQFEKPQKEIVKGKENIYVIDTNVFVDCPDVISKIDKKHSIVLSAKVIDELDFLKISLGEEQKRNVQKALRLINESLDTRGVKMHTEELALLPNDFNKKSPDNSILSVALKFKSENPIMLTSDNGLQIKAKGLGVTTISLRDFLKQKKY